MLTLNITIIIFLKIITIFFFNIIIYQVPSNHLEEIYLDDKVGRFYRAGRHSAT